MNKARLNNAKAYRAWATANDVDRWWIEENAEQILFDLLWFDVPSTTLVDTPD